MRKKKRRRKKKKDHQQEGQGIKKHEALLLIARSRMMFKYKWRYV